MPRNTPEDFENPRNSQSGSAENVASIQGEVVIARPMAEAFDFVANGRNDPKYRRSMLRAEKLTQGGIRRDNPTAAHSTGEGQRRGHNSSMKGERSLAT